MPTEDDKTLSRLFIGGLHDGITETELGNRFKSFGVIKDFQIIKKTDGQGNINNTFAYMNILSTQPMINKCLTTFGKTKWMGKELRVQVAKSSPLEIYKLERKDAQNPSAAADPDDEEQYSMRTYDDFVNMQKGKKSIPGSLIEGEKNWVVAKYGRVLPITYLRRRDMRKIAKFDPSKYLHSIRHLKDDDECDRVSVNDLHWDMISIGSKEASGLSELKQATNRHNGVTNKNKSRKQELISSSSESDSDEDSNQSKNSSKKRRLEWENSPIIANEKAIDDTVMASSENESLVSAESNESCSESSGEGLSDVETNSNTEHNEMSIIQKIKNLKEEDKNKMISPALVVDNTGDINTEDSPFDFKMKIDKSYTSNFLSSLEIVATNTTRDPTELSSSSDITESSSSASDGSDDNAEAGHQRIADGKRQSLSEQTRKLAIDSRLAIKQKKKDQIKGALDSIDKGTSNAGHVVFSNSDSDSDENDKKKSNAAVSKKKDHVVSGDKALKWLGFEGDDNNDDNIITTKSDDENGNSDNEGFGIKSHFEGKEGEKLFRLQQKFGTDKRFSLDERFIDNSDSDMDDDKESKDKENNVDDYDEISKQLSNERSMAMSIINEMLGGKTGFDSSVHEAIENEDFGRYDPDADDHAKYELPIKPKKQKEILSTEENVKDTKKETPLPEVDKQTYFNVDTKLKDLFSSNEQQGQFSFLPEKQDVETTHLQSPIEEVPAIVSRTIHRFDDESGSDDEGGQSKKAKKAKNSADSVQATFFFTKNDPRLQDDSPDGPSKFMRTKSIEEIIEDWNRVKQKLTLDYKRKHKDAIRRKRKQNTKKRR